LLFHDFPAIFRQQIQPLENVKSLYADVDNWNDSIIARLGIPGIRFVDDLRGVVMGGRSYSRFP